MSNHVDDFDDLRVYRTAFQHSMQIFELSDEWPKEERYALTDQIRRSSGAVCSNIAEAWSKRRYEAPFISKLSDAEGEAAETITWLDFAQSCGYLSDEEHEQLRAEYRKIRGGLIKMMKNPDPWCGPSALREPRTEYVTDESNAPSASRKTSPKPPHPQASNTFRLPEPPKPPESIERLSSLPFVPRRS